MNATRRARLVALGRLHDQWVDEHVAAASDSFDASKWPEGSGYNVHHVDIDASPEAQDAFHRQATAIMCGEEGQV